MFRFIILSTVLASSLGVPRTFRPRYVTDERIVGGSEVSIEEVPYQLSYEEFDRHICGASIINEYWALTAAHCSDGANPKDVRVRTGSDMKGSGGILHYVTEILVHLSYHPFSLDNDIALVQVTTPFVWTPTTAAISMPEERPIVGTIARVSGWGAISFGGVRPDQLRWVEVPIVDQSVCEKAYADTEYGITANMICAGYTDGGKDACNGDSGGPLVVDGELVGIVSWGTGCADPLYPGVYTDVVEFLFWIEGHTGV